MGATAEVDPQRDTNQYLAFAAEHGLSIRHVILTHVHSDFIAGHLELRDRVGAQIHRGAAAKHEGEPGILPKDRPLMVHCAGGYRSSVAASVLEKNGFDGVSELACGIAG